MKKVEIGAEHVVAYADAVYNGQTVSSIGEWLGLSIREYPSIGQVNLCGIRLSGVSFNSIYAVACMLMHSDLSNADFTDALMSGGCLVNANMRGSTLTKASIIGGDLTNACMVGVHASGVLLQKTDCYGTDFQGADLTQGFFTGAVCIGANFFNANMGGTTLYNADFTGAILIGAQGIVTQNLQGANGSINTPEKLRETIDTPIDSMISPKHLFIVQSALKHVINHQELQNLLKLTSDMLTTYTQKYKEIAVNYPYLSAAPSEQKMQREGLTDSEATLTAKEEVSRLYQFRTLMQSLDSGNNNFAMIHDELFMYIMPRVLGETYLNDQKNGIINHSANEAPPSKDTEKPQNFIQGIIATQHEKTFTQRLANSNQQAGLGRI